MTKTDEDEVDFDINAEGVEHLEIWINPEDSSYIIHAHSVQAGHLYDTLQDMIRRIESGEMAAKADKAEDEENILN